MVLQLESWAILIGAKIIRQFDLKINSEVYCARVIASYSVLNFINLKLLKEKKFKKIRLEFTLRPIKLYNFFLEVKFSIGVD